MSYESDPDGPDDRRTLLVIKLADQVIKSQVDCMLLWDEIESISTDFPGYLVIFEI